MSYKFNPLVSLGLDQVANYTALNLLGTVANQAALPGGATTGDVYQAEDTGIFYVWDGAAWDSIGTLAGPAGPAGATGPAGADGQTILNGTVDPTDNVTGTDGDFYINTTSNEIFGPRTAGAWGSGTSLVGPAGAGGATTLGGLTDVDLTTSPPTNGEALVYDSVNSEWVPGSAGATAAGAANQIQYNDGAGGLAASSDFTVDPDWNDGSTVFTGLKLNVTDTASATGSNLLDLQRGGTSKAFITTAGYLGIGTGLNGNNFIQHGLSINAGLALIGNNSSAVNNNSSYGALIRGTQFWLNGSGYLGWSSNLFANTDPDVALARDSSGVVKITKGFTGTGYVKQTPVLVSALPAAATVGAGTRGFVSDATATTFASAVTGSGSASTAGTVPVYSDGTDWRIG